MQPAPRRRPAGAAAPCQGVCPSSCPQDAGVPASMRGCHIHRGTGCRASARPCRIHRSRGRGRW
eukprot:15431071-Alexandrium_andersonii.AAC.1